MLVTDNKLTLDNLPIAVHSLTKKVNEIKSLIQEINALQSIEQDELPIEIEAACSILGIAKPTMYSKICRGEISSMKRNGKHYFLRSELIAYIKQGRRKSNSEIEADAHTYIYKKGLKDGR